MHRLPLLMFVVVLFPMSLSAQTFFEDSFETPPGVSYTMSAQFDDGGFDFFDRYAVPDLTNGARDDFLIGWDGSFGIMAQDHDGDGNAPTQSIVIAGIDITGRTNIVVGALFGALDSEPTFQNFDASDADGIEVYVAVDGGARTLIGAFKPPADGDGDLYEDTDLNGVGDGSGLTVALGLFQFSVAGTGASLTVEIEMTTTDSFEAIALDRVMVGEGSVPVELQTFSIE